MQTDIAGGIDQVDRLLKVLERDIATQEGKTDILYRQNEDYEGRLKQYEKDTELFRKAIELVGMAGTTARESLKIGFEGIVTHALRSIVGEDYRFEIGLSKRGNLQEADFNVKSGELTLAFDPMDSRGGGIVDIISIALRVSLLELFYPRIQGPLILDEPFKHLSSIYINGAGEFLNGIAEKMGRQIIVVTHIHGLTYEADNIVEVK
jgi:DNA repair exonuclease SbcCD ATPase subunit